MVINCEGMGMTLKDHAHQVSEQTVGKGMVLIGGGGSILDYLSEWETAVNVFVKLGNAGLIAGGLYLMAVKIMDKRKLEK